MYSVRNNVAINISSQLVRLNFFLHLSNTHFAEFDQVKLLLWNT